MSEILSLEQIEDEVGMLVRGGGDADRVLTQFMALRAALAAAERRAEEAEALARDLRGAMDADDNRLRAVSERVFGDYAFGCDTAMWLADETLGLRQKLASERAAREAWEREFDVANAERIRLHNEAENLAERLGQFEAYGFPNVATVLDRIGAERAEMKRGYVEQLARLETQLVNRRNEAEALRAENERLREALLSLARIETDEDGLPVLVISCGFHCQTSDQTELPLVWAVLASLGGAE